MKSKLKISISVLVLILFSGIANSFHIEEGLGGHTTITGQALGIKSGVHSGDSAFDKLILKNQKAIIQGTVEADKPAIKTRTHFYDPRTGKGFLGIYPSALQKGVDNVNNIRRLLCAIKRDPISGDLSSMRMEEIQNLKGETLHLLQDMASPAHVNDQQHIPVPVLYGGDTTENWVRDNWNILLPEIANEITVDKYSQSNCKFNPNRIQDYFRTLAQSAEIYPYDTNLRAISEENAHLNARNLVPRAILCSAGLIDSLYDLEKQIVSEGNMPGSICDSPPELVNPGGDHPDDRFDVSDEYYWEKEYGLSEAALADFYMRTAIRKGKIGVWWKKQLSDSIVKISNLPSTITQEDKDALRAEYEAIVERVRQNGERINSDWTTAPDIALFAYGFYKPSISLMLKYKEPVAFMGLDFNPQIVKDHPVMVIPSGGLYGLENSAMLKAQFSEYVKQGGTLIVFAQQHGYEFNILPVPMETDGKYKTITGYGWTEDQSCFTNAVYIDTYQQFLSGQNKSTPTLNVDGYFTDFPSSATVISRRTANGQPSMIMYDYGLGKVIVSSLFSDWGYGHNQTSPDEIALVRDMISWAKKPSQLPEIKPGQSVQVQVEVKNNTTTDAASVKLFIYNPDRTTALNTQLSAVSIPAGSFVTLPVSFTSTLTSALGIYHIDYELYDSNGNLIQPQAETDSGRFVVSNPPSSPAQISQLTFSIQSDSEQYAYGSTATFTVVAFNNSDVERTVTAKGEFGTKNIIVPAKSSSSFTYFKTVTYTGRLWVQLYEGNTYIGRNHGVKPSKII